MKITSRILGIIAMSSLLLVPGVIVAALVYHVARSVWIRHAERKYQRQTKSRPQGTEFAERMDRANSIMPDKGWRELHEATKEPPGAVYVAPDFVHTISMRLGMRRRGDA